MPTAIPGPPPLATTTLNGLVSTVSQSFAGPKTLIDRLTISKTAVLDEAGLVLPTPAVEGTFGYAGAIVWGADTSRIFNSTTRLATIAVSKPLDLVALDNSPRVYHSAATLGFTAVGVYLGTGTADGSVDAGAKVVSFGTGIGGTYVEKLHMRKGGGLRFLAGSATDVAFGPNGDDNTGWWFPALDTINLVTGGNLRTQWSSTGALLHQGPLSMPTNTIFTIGGSTVYDSPSGVLNWNGTHTLATNQRVYFNGNATSGCSVYSPGTTVLEFGLNNTTAWAMQRGTDHDHLQAASARGAAVFGRVGGTSGQIATKLGTDVADGTFHTGSEIVRFATGITGTEVGRFAVYKGGQANGCEIGAPGVTGRLIVNNSIGWQLAWGGSGGFVAVDANGSRLNSNQSIRTVFDTALGNAITASGRVLGLYAAGTSGIYETVRLAGSRGDAALKCVTVGTESAAPNAACVLLQVAYDIDFSSADAGNGTSVFNVLANGNATAIGQIASGGGFGFSAGSGGYGVTASGFSHDSAAGWAQADNASAEAHRVITSTVFATAGASIMSWRNNSAFSGTPAMKLRIDGTFVGGSSAGLVGSVGGAGNVATYLGTTVADGSVNATAKLVSMGTGYGGTYVESLSFRKGGQIWSADGTSSVIVLDPGGFGVASSVDIVLQSTATASRSVQIYSGVNGSGNRAVQVGSSDAAPNAAAKLLSIAYNMISGGTEAAYVTARGTYGTGTIADASGSPGNATQDAQKGRAALANAASAVVITNDQVTTDSVVTIVWEKVPNNSSVPVSLAFKVTYAAGSFTVTTVDPGAGDTAMACDNGPCIFRYIIHQ